MCERFWKYVASKVKPYLIDEPVEPPVVPEEDWMWWWTWEQEDWPEKVNNMRVGYVRVGVDTSPLHTLDKDNVPIIYEDEDLRESNTTDGKRIIAKKNKWLMIIIVLIGLFNLIAGFNTGKVSVGKLIFIMSPAILSALFLPLATIKRAVIGSYSFLILLLLGAIYCAVFALIPTKDGQVGIAIGIVLSGQVLVTILGLIIVGLIKSIGSR